jgi:hypothetical protein
VSLKQVMNNDTLGGELVLVTIVDWIVVPGDRRRAGPRDHPASLYCAGIGCGTSLPAPAQ